MELVEAAEKGDVVRVEQLMSAGANVEVRDDQTRTALSRAASGGHMSVVRLLMEQGADVNASDTYGWTPLIEASNGGHLDVVRYLVDHGAAVDVRINDGWTPLMMAVSGGHLDVVRYLMEQGADANASNTYGWTPLIEASNGGHLDVVRYLMEHGAAVDVRVNDGCTPLIMAVSGGHLDVVRYLVENGAAVDASKNHGDTPLMWAVSGGHLDVVRYLVENGAVVDAIDKGNRTPLMQAACYGHLDVLRFLLEQGAAVDGRDNNGWTPLIMAANIRNWNVVRFLVEHGVDLGVSSSDYTTPLIESVQDNQLDIARFLLDHGADVNASDAYGRTPLTEAVRYDYKDVVRFLVDHGAAVDTHKKDGRTPLMHAANCGDFEMVRFFVDHGSAVNARDSEGQTPLAWAVFNGQLDVVSFLLKHGAAVDALDGNRETQLLRVASGGQLDMARILVDHGADVDARDSLGSTPLMTAVLNGHLDMMRFLVEHGADMNAVDRNGETQLLRVASDGQLDVVRILVDRGAAVDGRDIQGSTPLMKAVYYGHLDVVSFLVEHGADVNAHDEVGKTPLMQGAGSGHLDVIRLLVERGAAVDAHDNTGTTPLNHATRGNYLDVAQLLVEHGATVDSHDNNRSTPLMGAAVSGNLDMARFLVEHGADMNARNSDGWTPFMLSARDGHLDIVRFLVELGASYNLISTAGDSALGIATKFGRQEVVQFLLPLVRYQDRRTQTKHLDECEGRHYSLPSSWLIPPFEVEVEPFVDAGHIGGDFRGKWLDADVVVKLFVDDTASTSFVDEVRLWHQLRHPNILKLYGVCDTEHKLFVCEYASKGSLPEYLKSCDPKRRTLWKFLYEAALGLEYLHERKIVHGNLRGSNILIGSDGLAKLSRFGLSAPSSEVRQFTFGAMVRWTAPEVVLGEQVSLTSDVYSLGMCILEVLSNKIPFNMESEDEVVSIAKYGYTDSVLEDYLALVADERRVLLLAMCDSNPRERLQMPAVVDKLERFAEIEAAELAQQTAQPDPEPFVNLDAFDEFDHAKTTILWNQVQELGVKSENSLYHQLWHELELIYDTLKAECHPWSTLERFHDLLSECHLALDGMSQQNRICRLSATRARDYSVEGLHRRISQLLYLVCPQENDAETRETEWKRLCREQVEIFVSEASETCVMLSSIDSEEDRSALVAVLRAELRNSDGKYTEKQLAVLQETCDDIVSKSLEDVHLATTPEWFIPWFELEMNEMKTLGEGGFGSVIKAKWLDSEVVVKKLEIADKDAGNADKKREMRQMFEREVDIWFGLSHPHVVRLFGACHVGRPFFVCELAPNGTLDEYLRKHPDELWLKLREAALGVQYLHARGIVHGDLKGNNILIGSDGKAKVTDFGLSGVFDDDSADMMVSEAMHWVAPECMLKQKPTFASDIYSLAMCIIEALRVTNGDDYTLPWGKLPNAAVKFNVTRRHLLPPRPRNCLDETWTLIECMCKSDPADRMLIMTVVDEFEKLAGRHGDLSGETDYVVIDNDNIRLSSSSVTHTLAEMKQWIANCDTNRDWEMNALTSIYQLLWDRLEQVATRLFPDGEDTVIDNTTANDFSTLVEQSKQRTREALGITGDIPLIKFTELALGGYALHRRLDKFMAAHAVANEPSSLHDWTSACSAFMGVSNSPTLAFSDGDCSAKEETGGGTRMASSTEVVATL